MLHFDETKLFSKKSFTVPQNSRSFPHFLRKISSALHYQKVLNEVTLRTRKRVFITENLKKNEKLHGKDCFDNLFQKKNLGQVAKCRKTIRRLSSSYIIKIDGFYKQDAS